VAALGVESAVSDCILFLRPQPDVRWMGRRLAIGVDSTARVLRIDVINHAKSGHHLISVSATNVRARCASIAVSSLFFGGFLCQQLLQIEHSGLDCAKNPSRNFAKTKTRLPPFVFVCYFVKWQSKSDQHLLSNSNSGVFIQKRNTMKILTCVQSTN